MKKMIFALMVMLTATVSASAMSYEQARNEALFLTDKMAYELNLTDAQYEAAYEINLDYLMGVTSYNDVFGTYWERRNIDLSYILYSWQWDLFRAATYFYRPLYWDAGYWHFAIYARYPHRDYFYFGRPHFYATYRGGHSWHLNGGRSYYHGRADHFRPALANGRQHFGMRNGYDRGDYRGGRGGSSTRVTGRQDRRFDDRPNRSDIGGSRSGNYEQNRSGRFGGSRSSGSIENRGNRPSGNVAVPQAAVPRRHARSVVAVLQAVLAATAGPQAAAQLLLARSAAAGHQAVLAAAAGPQAAAQLPLARSAEAIRRAAPEPALLAVLPAVARLAVATSVATVVVAVKKVPASALRS